MRMVRSPVASAPGKDSVKSFATPAARKPRPHRNRREDPAVHRIRPHRRLQVDLVQLVARRAEVRGRQRPAGGRAVHRCHPQRARAARIDQPVHVVPRVLAVIGGNCRGVEADVVGSVQPVVAVLVVDVDRLLRPQVEQLHPGELERVDVRIRDPGPLQPGARDAGDPLPVRAHLEGRTRWRRPARCRARCRIRRRGRRAQRRRGCGRILVLHPHPDALAVHQLACARVEPQRVEQQALLHLPAVHVLARELRRHRRVEGVGPVGRLVPAEHLRHLVARPRLVHRRRVDPVARQHPAGLVQHLQARLPARRHVQQYPLQRQLRQPRLQRIAVHVGRNAQPLEALAAHLDRTSRRSPASPARGSPRGRPRRAPARPHPPPARRPLRPRTPGSCAPPRRRSRPRRVSRINGCGAARVLQPVGHPVPVAVQRPHRSPPGSTRTPAPSRPATRPRPSPRTPDRAASPHPLTSTSSSL